MHQEPIIQWYPGHIAKLERELQQHLKLLDVLVEVRDARIPLTTGYNDLAEKWRDQKPTLLVLNKSDLADPNWTTHWKTTFLQQYPAVCPFDSTQSQGKQAVIDAILKLGETRMKKLEAKGLKRRPLRLGVVGMPNVGKSTLINCLVGQKKVKTGHRAGVTRQPQWVRIHPLIELLDTPGLIPARLVSQEQGERLAMVYSIGDAAFDEEKIAPLFLNHIESLYPGHLRKAFDLPATAEAPWDEAIARRRGFLLPGDKLDSRRTAQAILKDFRLGRLGRLTLEKPNDVVADDLTDGEA